ncbi:uncharacterized protein LOC121369130 [Gigantopelta aegis]|uniref:uncharacterized protein LOC121369130 n=1 Tax=Gigantopelta aegis TaxID=1735272 RepID=UPI001B888388|nr:uncharacterized protein LOC121369130 [Gigantopelta aegis]
MANGYAVNKKKKKKAPRVLGETISLRDHSTASLRYLVLTGKKVKRKRREYTTDRSFRVAAGIKIDPCPLNEYVTWFSWQMAVCPSRRGKSKYEWHHRKTGPGYYRYQLFRAFRNQRAIYEVGVQVPGRSRIYSVYYRGCYCGMSASVYKYMLSEERIADEIDDIILRKGKIFIRRGVLNDMNSSRYKLCTGYIKMFFSYAWNSRNPQTGRHRTASRRGFQISGAPIRRKPSVHEKNSSENSNVPVDERSDTEQHREIKLISVNDRIANSEVVEKSRPKGKKAGVKSSRKKSVNSEHSSQTDDIENEYSDSDSQTDDNENEDLHESDSDSADSQNWALAHMQKSIDDLKMIIDQTNRIQQDEEKYLDVPKSKIVESPESDARRTIDTVGQDEFESHKYADPGTGNPVARVRLVHSNLERGSSHLKEKESISTI